MTKARPWRFIVLDKSTFSVDNDQGSRPPIPEQPGKLKYFNAQTITHILTFQKLYLIGVLTPHLFNSILF